MDPTSSEEVTRFSTASTTPCFVLTPTTVEPNCKYDDRRWAWVLEDDRQWMSLRKDPSKVDQP